MAAKDPRASLLATIEEEIAFAEVCFSCNHFAWECNCNMLKQEHAVARAERRLQWDLRRKRAATAQAMADKEARRFDAALTLQKMRAEQAKLGGLLNPIQLSSDEEEEINNLPSAIHLATRVELFGEENEHHNCESDTTQDTLPY